MIVRKVISTLIKEANEGDVVSQIMLGYHYLYGFNIQRDLEKSYEIFNRLAEEGYTYAEDAINNCFSAPGVLNEDFKEFYEDLHDAIEFWDNKEIVYGYGSTNHAMDLSGSLRHHLLLANCFLDGYGVPKNEEFGFMILDCLQKTFNHYDVTYALCYLNGVGTKKNPSKGYRLLDKIHKEEPENAEATYHLASCYSYGLGTDTDFEKARQLYEKAVELGYHKAYYDLGMIYRFGEGVTVDMQKAISFYEKGLALGDGRCAANLGAVYNNGINGVPQDLNLAKEIYLKGIDLRNADSMFNLGAMYYLDNFGNGVPDYEKAVYYFEMAAELGEPDSMYHLGLCYLEGKGVELNQDYGIDLIISAARRGIEGAQKLLDYNGINWKK